MTSYNSYSFEHIEKEELEKENIENVNNIIIDEDFLCENVIDSINFKNYFSLILNIHDTNKHSKTFINFYHNSCDCVCCGEECNMNNVENCKSGFMIEYRIDNTEDLSRDKGLYININSTLKNDLPICYNCKYNINKMEEKKSVYSGSIQNTENKTFKNIIYIFWKKDIYPFNIISILKK
jgi:hypothetical protein